MVGWFSPTSATALDVITLLVGEADVPPIQPRPPPGREPKTRLGLGIDGLHVVPLHWGAILGGLGVRGRVAMGGGTYVAGAPAATMVWRLAGEALSHLPRRRQLILAAWCSLVLAIDASEWTSARRQRCSSPWRHRSMAGLVRMM